MATKCHKSCDDNICDVDFSTWKEYCCKNINFLSITDKTIICKILANKYGLEIFKDGADGSRIDLEKLNQSKIVNYNVVKQIYDLIYKKLEA